MRRWLLAALLACAATAALAQVGHPAPPVFRDHAEETRFRALVTELRCVMCQNQSLADSNALVAQDLRREVLALMREGRSDAQIEDYLVARYGEFVLYKPRVEERTWLLWFGPVALLLGGGIVVALVVRRHARAGGAGQPVVDDDAQEW